ncbi:hypothetical protein Zmor_027179 [Zophobas morio]|uniref:Uncharacterized protein n=1 Tax=Zophobas morio TaxID=2755281 RepID=A0AA38M355_9CUCU|nr:hypothetical protein Zmor_027179 [Zophobas morio]
MLLLVVLLVSAVQATPMDSYLEAYQESHGTTAKMDREYTEPYPYPPSQPGYHYGPPKYSYGPPAAPVHNYGPPLAPVYGPPAPAPIYGMPHGMLGLLDKLKLKLDLFTIGKILLKVVLFKKFVSFVAVLCLLLFIPTLKRKVDNAVPDGGDDDDDEDAAMRGFGKKKNKAGDEFLNNITEFVMGAIDNFSKNYTGEAKCESVFCKTKKVVQGIDDKLSYRKLAEVYSREIQP